MKYSYLVECKHCHNEIQGIYDSDKNIVYLDQCPYCLQDFSGSDTEYLRLILYYISSTERRCPFTVLDIHRKNL